RSARPGRARRRRARGRSGLAGPPTANPDAGAPRSGGARSQCPRSLCGAGPSHCRPQARGNPRPRIDDRSHGHRTRPRANSRGSNLRRRSDPGTSAADRGIIFLWAFEVLLVMAAEVEMYTTMFCPYCTRARTLLERKGAAFTEIDIIEEPARRAEMS